MKNILIAVGVVLSLFAARAIAQPAPRILICHHTGSTTNPTVTIEISENAWPAHQKHGDTKGACMNQSNPVPNPNPDPTVPDDVPTPVVPKPETLPVDVQEEMVGK